MLELQIEIDKLIIELKKRNLRTDMFRHVKHIISFSGGMGSFAEAYFCCQLYGVENCILLFANVLIEDEDLYRFLNESILFLKFSGHNYVELCEGKTPFDIFKEKNNMGSRYIDPCSEMLKRNPLTDWVRNNFKPWECQVHLGIDYSEIHRLERACEYKKPYIYRSLLCENKLILNKSFSERFGIKRPRLYDWGLGHNNCGGYCVKAGMGHYKKLFEANKERYIQHEDSEQDVYANIKTNFKILRKTTNGEKEYMSLKDFRIKYLENNSTTVEDNQEFGGCGCAI